MIACLRTLGLHGKLKTAHLVVLLIAAAGPPAAAQTTADTETPASLFKAKCAICHAEDGSGTALGNRLHVKDLRAKEIQEKSSKELAQAISAGTDKMPAFKGRLDDDQIQSLIEYIRHKMPSSP